MGPAIGAARHSRDAGTCFRTLAPVCGSKDFAALSIVGLSEFIEVRRSRSHIGIRWDKCEFPVCQNGASAAILTSSQVIYHRLTNYVNNIRGLTKDIRG